MKCFLNLFLIFFGAAQILSAQDNEADLITAAEKQNEKKVFYLLKAGTNPNTATAYGVTPLMYASDNGNQYIVKTLLKYDADPNLKSREGTPALIAAVKKNHVEIAEMLIDAGADVNAIDGNGLSALMYAADYGYPLLSYKLCQAGAETDKTYNNWTPLMVAAYYDDTQVVQALLDCGADTEIVDIWDNSALLLAAQQGGIETVKILTESGANIYQRNNYGFSALEFAVHGNRPELVKYLLQQGLKPSKYSGDKTTKMLAEFYGHKEISELLEQKNVQEDFDLSFGDPFYGLTQNFNWNDYQIGAEAGFSESTLRLDFSAAYLIRPFRKKVLIKDSENTYYQYRELRNTLSVSAIKRFNFLPSEIKQFGLLAGGKARFSFGGYKGAGKMFAELIPTPQAGLYYQKNYTRILFSYEYANFKPVNISPHYFGITIVSVPARSFHIDLKRPTF